MTPTRRLRIALCSGATLAWLLAAAPASADFFLNPNGFEPVKGTVSYSTALQAGIANSRIYGAVYALQRNLLPYLKEDGDYIAVYENNQLWGVSKLAGTCGSQEFISLGSNPCSEGGGMVLHDADTFAASVVLGKRFGPVSFYYGTSVSAIAFYPDVFSRYLAYQGIVPAYGLIYSVAAPFNAANGVPEDINKPMIDYVAGAGLDLGVADVRLGYVGSQGLYSNVTQDDINLFVTAVLADEFKKLGYVGAGLDRLPISKDLLASLYGRKLALASDETLREIDPASTAKAKGADLLTAHAEALNLLENFDAIAALAMQPGVFLHEARVRYHSVKVDETRFEPEETSYSFSGGVVKLPDLWYYGVEGGLRPMFEVKVDFVTEEQDMPVSLILRMNDPETLSQFPFAQNSFNLYYRVGLSTPQRR